MSKIGDKMRKARESVLTYDKPERGPVTFQIRRPTECDMLDFSTRVRAEGPRTLLRFVIGWTDVTEGHLIPHGDPHPLDFDPDALFEWVSDDIDLFNFLVGAIIDAHAKASKALAAATGK